MAKIFLSLLFVLQDGTTIVPGNQIHGWHDREQESMQVCMERSRFIFSHPENTPKWALTMVSFCKEGHGG